MKCHFFSSAVWHSHLSLLLWEGSQESPCLFQPSEPLSPSQLGFQAHTFPLQPLPAPSAGFAATRTQRSINNHLPTTPHTRSAQRSTPSSTQRSKEHKQPHPCPWISHSQEWLTHILRQINEIVLIQLSPSFTAAEFNTESWQTLLCQTKLQHCTFFWAGRDDLCSKLESLISYSRFLLFNHG